MYVPQADVIAQKQLALHEFTECHMPMDSCAEKYTHTHTHTHTHTSTCIYDMHAS
jgi:hypothetical protein